MKKGCEDHSHRKIDVLRRYDERQRKIMNGEFIDISENVGGVCPECIKIIQERGQERLRQVIDNKPNDKLVWIKAYVYDGDDSEIMWLYVKKYKMKHKKIVAILDNEPVDLPNIKCGDRLEIPFEDVVDVMVDNNV